MARTEEALTEAKRMPSDGFVIYKPSQKLISERSINARAAHEIVACLKEDRFKLAFQPIVDADTREIVMHEALLRMADERGDMIAAAHLIPIAESSAWCGSSTAPWRNSPCRRCLPIPTPI